MQNVIFSCIRMELLHVQEFWGEHFTRVHLLCADSGLPIPINIHRPWRFGLASMSSIAIRRGTGTGEHPPLRPIVKLNMKKNTPSSKWVVPFISCRLFLSIYPPYKP